MAKYYVYTYVYPVSMGGVVFYVGKGTGNRIDIHELEAKRGYTSKKHDIIRSILNAGEQVVKSIVFETDDEHEAFAYEYKLIKQYAPTLTNIVANPNAVHEYEKVVNIPFTKKAKPNTIDYSSEEYFQMIFERAKWLNRGLAERYPADQRETFLVETNAQSEKYLRRKQAMGWNIANILSSEEMDNYVAR